MAHSRKKAIEEKGTDTGPNHPFTAVSSSASFFSASSSSSASQSRSHFFSDNRLPVFPTTDSVKNIEEKGEVADLLPGFPNDILRHTLFGYLSNDLYTRWQLVQHPQFAHLPTYKLAISEIKFLQRRLLDYVAKGRKKEAEALLESNPEILRELLTYSGEVKTYATSIKSPVFVEGTALEIALGAEDVNLYDKQGKLLGEGMVEMVHRFLRKLDDGETLIGNQTLKQFPKGWEDQEEKRHQADLIALRTVRDAIKDSSNNEACKAAILKFKKHLAPKDVIKTGKHWNAKLLQAAFDMGYNEYFYDYGKDSLFYDEIVGYIQLLAPANYAMVQAQGLKYLLEYGENFERDLKYQHGDGHYYPRVSAPGFRWVDCYLGGRDGWWSVLTGVLGGAGGTLSRLRFQNYVGAKTAVLRQFMPRPDSHANTRSWCAVM